MNNLQQWLWRRLHSNLLGQSILLPPIPEYEVTAERVMVESGPYFQITTVDWAVRTSSGSRMGLSDGYLRNAKRG